MPAANPLNPRDRIASVVSDMRMCALQDRVNAARHDSPLETRTYLTANAVLVEHWAAVLEHVLKGMPS